MKRILFIIMLTVFLNSTVFGTRQIPDKIIYNGKKYELWHSNPMESYFKKYPEKYPKEDRSSSTALWRGYVATFEIKGKQLYLSDIEIYTRGKNADSELKWESVLNKIFPNQTLKIDWVTGLFVLPVGKIVEEPQRYGDPPTYENYILLEMDKGVLKKEKQFGYKEYEDFKKEQFDAFKNTDEYEQIRSNLHKKRFSDESINSLIQYSIIEYTTKILVE